MKKRILLIGSAPYMQSWISDNEEGIKHHFIYALNNAWALYPHRIHTWLYSSDFFKLPQTLKPTAEQMSEWNTVVKFLDAPIWYNKKESGTMILNALCHILNQNHGTPFELRIAGCDLVYGKGKDHFYEGGTPDPVLLGTDYLRTELERLKKKAERVGVDIYNVGGQTESILPFDAGCL